MLADWKIAWRNLQRNRRRHLLTGAAIALGGAGMVLLGGYIVRMQEYMEVHSVYINHKGHIAVFKRGGFDRHYSDPRRYGLSGEEQGGIEAVLRQEPGVDFTGRYLEGMALLGNGCDTTPVFATGVEVPVERRIRAHPRVIAANPELVKVEGGPGFWDAPEAESPVSITAELARLIGKPRTDGAPGAEPLDCERPDAAAAIAADNRVQLLAQTYQGDFGGRDARVVSHHTTGMELLEATSLTAPLTTLQALYETKVITYLAVFLKDPAQTRATLARLRQAFATTPLEVDLYPFDDPEVSLFYVGAMDFLYVMAAFFVLLVWGVSALSLVNSLTMTVVERSKELGMLRAMGFMPARIAGLLVKECALLCVFSLVVAELVAVAAAAVVNQLNIRFQIPGLAGTLQFKLTPTWGLFALMAVSSLAVSVGSAYLVSRLKLRKSAAQLIQAVTG